MRNCNNKNFGSATDTCKRLCPPAVCSSSRRQFVKALSALGASAILPGAAGLMAQTTSRVGGSKPTRIDVHHHLFSPTYMRLSDPAGHGNPRSLPALAHWTPARAVEELDRYDIATAVLSIATGGIPAKQAGESRTLMRDSNEYGAQMVRDYTGRFGLFASLPLLDQDASLREIEYGFDTLKADGIALTTDYGDKWPGDPAFVPAFEELNRRKAVVFVHPTTPACCSHLIPGVPPSWVEYGFDTTRAIVSFLVNGTFTRFPNIRFIFAHSGGTIPVLARRIAELFPPELAGRAPDGVESEVKKLYFDIANGVSPSSLAALTKLVPVSQILFGSDFPFVNISTTVDGFRGFGFQAKDVQAINRGNALRLFPRLRK
jgi:predicted TIM-barrel fold metal-dependent hydrolase